MSYDYMLGRGDVAGGIEGFMESAMTAAIGTSEEIKTSLSALFPSVQWTSSQITPRPEHEGTFLQALGSQTVFWRGLMGPPEFHFGTDEDGHVQLLTMSHCERAEVELVARTLGLVAIDQQTMELFGG